MNELERVEAYSSYKYAVEPRAFYLQEKRHVVDEIDREWKSPGHVHFYVHDEQHQFFELIYEEINDRWFLRRFGETCSVATQSTKR